MLTLIGIVASVYVSVHASNLRELMQLTFHIQRVVHALAL
jgi:hypothetical protein